MTQLTLEQALDLAKQQHEAGQLATASDIYRQILAAVPNHAETLQLAGLIEFQSGRSEAAVELITRAIQIGPPEAHYFCNLAKVLLSLNRYPQTIAACRQGLMLPADPSISEQLHDHLARAQNGMGTLALSHRKLNEAVDWFTAAAASDPQSADAWHNLGTTLFEIRRFDQSVDALRKAIELRPDHPDTHNNLGNSLHELGQIQVAIECYRRAIALNPEWPKAHYNFAVSLLALGQSQEGWAEYEWRTRVGALQNLYPKFEKLRWTGSDLSGQKLLIYNEQGLGDTLQFSRYVPLLAERGAKVILKCQSELASLLKTLPGVWQVVTEFPLPSQFDLHCPMLSLPLALGNLIPSNVPYLGADEHRSHQWREKLTTHPGKKVGLVWAGAGGHGRDDIRSIALHQLVRLLKMQQLHFISLQKESPAEQLKSLAQENRPMDVSEELSDFSDTAALIDNLDLLISVDTAVAHLAGAMGKPVWVLLPFVPDWRWGLSGQTSAWYPTLKLFRQPAAGDWNAPIMQVADSLRGFAEGGCP